MRVKGSWDVPNATVLRLLGLDHEKLSYTNNGRRFRLTDVAGAVIKPILA